MGRIILENGSVICTLEQSENVTKGKSSEMLWFNEKEDRELTVEEYLEYLYED